MASLRFHSERKTPRGDGLIGVSFSRGIPLARLQDGKVENDPRLVRSDRVALGVFKGLGVSCLEQGLSKQPPVLKVITPTLDALSHS